MIPLDVDGLEEHRGGATGTLEQFGVAAERDVALDGRGIVALGWRGRVDGNVVPEDGAYDLIPRRELGCEGAASDVPDLIIRNSVDFRAHLARTSTT